MMDIHPMANVIHEAIGSNAEEAAYQESLLLEEYMIQSNLQEVPEGIPKVDNAGFGSIYDHSRVSNLENDTNWGGDSEGWNGNQYIQGGLRQDLRSAFRGAFLLRDWWIFTITLVLGIFVGRNFESIYDWLPNIASNDTRIRISREHMQYPSWLPCVDISCFANISPNSVDTKGCAETEDIILQPDLVDQKNHQSSLKHISSSEQLDNLVSDISNLYATIILDYLTLNSITTEALEALRSSQQRRLAPWQSFVIAAFPGDWSWMRDKLVGKWMGRMREEKGKIEAIRNGLEILNGEWRNFNRTKDTLREVGIQLQALPSL